MSCSIKKCECKEEIPMFIKIIFLNIIAFFLSVAIIALTGNIEIFWKSWSIGLLTVALTNLVILFFHALLGFQKEDVNAMLFVFSLLAWVSILSEA